MRYGGNPPQEWNAGRVFYITTLIHDTENDSIHPRMPDNADFLLIYYGPDYCVLESYELSRMDSDKRLPDYTRRVPKLLQYLLRSSEAYPPARALAMDRLETGKLPLDAFFEEIEKLLTYHLEAQRTSNYLLLRASRDKEFDFYKTGGCYYWVLGLCGNEALYWVSSDCQIYFDPVADFDIEAEALLQHFRGPDGGPPPSPVPWRRFP